MCCCSCWPPTPPERVQGGEKKWGTLCSRKTGRMGLQIDNLKSWFYEFYEPVIVSPHIEESADTLHSGDCFLMTSRSLTDQQKLSTKKKKVLDCTYIVHTQLCLFATPWAIAPQAPLSMGFSRQEYWSGLPFPPPEVLPKEGIEPPSSAHISHFRWILYLWVTTWEALIACIPPSAKSHIYTLSLPHNSLEEPLRAIWGTVSWTAVLILPPKSLTRKSQVMLFFFQVNRLYHCFRCTLHSPKWDLSPLLGYALFYPKAVLLHLPDWQTSAHASVPRSC